MPRLTKKEKVAQYYYNSKKFDSSMEEYQNHLRGANLFRNRLKIAEKNEFGKIKEEKEKEVNLLKDAVVKSDINADKQLDLACDAFDELRKLLG